MLRFASLAATRVMARLPDDVAYDFDDAVQDAAIGILTGRRAEHAIIDAFIRIRGRGRDENGKFAYREQMAGIGETVVLGDLAPPDRRTEIEERLELVMAAMRRLTAVNRRVLTLVYLKQMPKCRVAAQLHRHPSAISRMLVSARDMVRAQVRVRA